MPVNDRGFVLLPYGHLPLIDFRTQLTTYAYSCHQKSAYTSLHFCGLETFGASISDI